MQTDVHLPEKQSLMSLLRKFEQAPNNNRFDLAGLRIIMPVRKHSANPVSIRLNIVVTCHSWLLNCSTRIHHGRSSDDVDTLQQCGWSDFEMVKDVTEGELGEGPCLFGDWFTAAVIMIGSLFFWKRLLGDPPGRHALEVYVDRCWPAPLAMKTGDN